MSTPDTSWSSVLDQLEQDVAAAEALLEHGSLAQHPAQPDDAPQWVQPEGLGPLPEHLGERATRLLTRQRHTTRELRHAASSAGAQLGFTSRVAEATHAPTGPAYLDISA